MCTIPPISAISFIKVPKIYFGYSLLLFSLFSFYNIYLIYKSERCESFEHHQINIHLLSQNKCKSAISWKEVLYPRQFPIEEKSPTYLCLPFLFRIKKIKPNHHVRIWHVCPKKTYTKNYPTNSRKGGVKIKNRKNHNGSKIMRSSTNIHDKQNIARVPPAFTGKLGKIDITPYSRAGPASEWHRYHPLTCNIIHETSILDGLYEIGLKDASTTNFTGNDNSTKVKFLSKGSQRASWLLMNNDLSSIYKEETVIMKTLIWDASYTKERYNYQRVDALATERLTSSNHVVNAYGFCGNSVLNEFSDGGDLFHYMKENENITLQQKLVFARDSAFGLKDIHGVGVDDAHEIPTLLHLDIKLHNFLVVKGKLKFHDFNNAHLQSRSKRTGKPRDIHRHVNCTTGRSNVYRRAPEECTWPQVISEKMEVYHLGVFFFTLLTKKEPYKFEDEGKRPLSEVLEWILDNHRKPKLPNEIESSDNSAVKTLIVAMRVCTRFNPMQRPSAKKLSLYFEMFP